MTTGTVWLKLIGGDFILHWLSNEAAGPLILCLDSADWPCADHMHSPKKKIRAKFSKEIRRRNCCSACVSLCLTLETILKRIFPKLGRRSDICKTLTLSDLRMQYRIRRWGHFSLKCRFAYANEDLRRSTKLFSFVFSA